MKYVHIVAVTAVLAASACVAAGVSAPKAGIRQPAVAGQFYPSDPTKLSNAIDLFLDSAVPPVPGRPLAVVAPHAGYVYSGQIAADAFKQAESHDYDLVVILGTNHTTAGFGVVSIYSGGGYKTPLGTAAVDEKLAADLIAADEDFTYVPSVHEREHSVEVQVPFVQILFPAAKLLTAVLGSDDPGLCSRFGQALAERIADRKALVVASTDLSHYPKYRDACDIDRSTLRTICDLDALEFHAATAERIISYANSGDAAFGTRDRVVGYGAVAFLGGPPNGCSVPDDPLASDGAGVEELPGSDKKALLEFARRSIRQFLDSDTTPLARGFDPRLRRRSGVFVTLRENGELRGCIGRMTDDLPLCQTVGYCAVQAAFN
ncbi:MAG: AmmeMemoRadiSam system protein B, partial [bacterium]